jgi:Flp pilus assembly protein TadD
MSERAAMLREILAQNPNDAFARYGLALEHANGGDVDAALGEFRKLIELNPDYVPGYQMGAQTLMKAGRGDEARPLLEQGIACAQRTGNRHAVSEMQGLLDELL